MASLHMQNSDDYRGGKSETSASVKEWTIFLGGRVSETHSEGEGQKYCRHSIGSVAQLQRLFRALCEYCSDCIQRFVLHVFKFSFQISLFNDSFE